MNIHCDTCNGALTSPPSDQTSNTIQKLESTAQIRVR